MFGTNGELRRRLHGKHENTCDSIWRHGCAGTRRTSIVRSEARGQIPQHFLVLRFITVASAMAPDNRTKANARSVFQPTLALLRMAGLFFCRGGELIGAGIGCIRRGFTMGDMKMGRTSTSRATA
jgi:hypothetical protein